jgi:drug/metabolite transporter (DMT)-like permease
MEKRVAHIELHIAVLLFGVSGLFGKLISASPTTIVLGRTAFAAIAIFIGLKLCSISLKLTSRKSLLIMSLSGLILALHWVTFFHAIQLSSVAIGLVGFATFPVFVTFLEPLLSGQKFRVIDIVSALLVTAGLILVAPDFDMTNSGTVGLLWAVLSGALFAVLTLINRHLVETNSFIVVAFFQHSIAALVLMPFVIYEGDIPDSNTLWLLLILGIICTALPQTLFIKSLAVLKAQLASVVTGLEPIYGIILAALILDEVPDLSTILGATIVFVAVILAMKAHSISGGGVPKKDD